MTKESVEQPGRGDLPDLMFSVNLVHLIEVYRVIRRVHAGAKVVLTLCDDMLSMENEREGLSCQVSVPTSELEGLEASQAISLAVDHELFDGLICNPKVWSVLAPRGADPNDSLARVSFKRIGRFSKAPPKPGELAFRITCPGFSGDWNFERIPATKSAPIPDDAQHVNPVSVKRALELVQPFASRTSSDGYSKISVESKKSRAASSGRARLVEDPSFPSFGVHIARTIGGPLADLLGHMHLDQCRMWLQGGSQGFADDRLRCSFPTSSPVPPLESYFETEPRVRVDLTAMELRWAFERIVSQTRDVALKDRQLSGNASALQRPLRPMTSQGGEKGQEQHKLELTLTIGETAKLTVATRVRGGEAKATCHGHCTQVSEGPGAYAIEIADASLVENVTFGSRPDAIVSVNVSDKAILFESISDDTRLRTLIPTPRKAEFVPKLKGNINKT